MLGYGLYSPPSLDWHFLLLNLLWLFACGWEYLYFQKLILLYAAAINLLTILVTTLLAAAMNLCALDVIMPFVTFVYYALLEDSADVHREQGVSGESASRPGNVFHPDFHSGRPTYFDISVRSALHSGVITCSASSPGFAALKGKMAKDARHRDLVEAAGDVFYPLVVDNFGVWTPSSIEVLRSIARSSTVRNGLSVAIAFYHLVERLSVQLYRYNARMVLHFWALHPHLEHDWLDACTRWEVGCSQLHQSHDDNEDEDQEGSGSTSPLNDSGASVLSEVSYVVDVCNRFACLPVEPTPDDCAVPTVMSDCSDSSCVNSSCLTPQLSPAISLSSNSRIPGSHGSHPAGLLVSKAASGDNLSLFKEFHLPPVQTKSHHPPLLHCLQMMLALEFVRL